MMCHCGECDACKVRAWMDRRDGAAHLRGSEYLTIPQVADLIGVGRGAVWYYIHGHYPGVPFLPSVRRHGTRGQHFIQKVDLIAWLDRTERWTGIARRELTP